MIRITIHKSYEKCNQQRCMILLANGLNWLSLIRAAAAFIMCTDVGTLKVHSKTEWLMPICKQIATNRIMFRKFCTDSCHLASLWKTFSNSELLINNGEFIWKLLRFGSKIMKIGGHDTFSLFYSIVMYNLQPKINLIQIQGFRILK